MLLAVFVSACGPTPPFGHCKVEIETADTAAWAWEVPPNARMVLLDLPQPPREGSITFVRWGADCDVVQEVELPTTSFKIVDGPEEGPAFAIRPGASMPGALSMDFEGGCSG